MTKKTSKLIYLIVSIVLAVAALTMIIVASVKSSKFGKLDYSQNLELKDITLNLEQSDSEVRLLCHDVTINGQVRNDSKVDHATIDLEIVLAGVKNDTGEYKEFVYTKEIRDFNSGVNLDLVDEKFTIISRDGYIPESIKEVRLVINGQSQVVPFEESDDTNLLLFALALGSLFVAGLTLSKWNNIRKTMVQKIEENIK